MSTVQRLQLIRASEAELKRNPKNVDAYVNLGILMRGDDRHAEAIQYFKKALALRKVDKIALMNLADSCSAMKDYTNAKKYARKLLEQEPRNVQFMQFQAEVLEKAGQASQALVVWQKLNQIKPNDPTLMDQMAECLSQMGKFEQAEQIYTQIRQIDPSFPHTLYMYANSKRFELPEAAEIKQLLDEAIPKTDDPIMKSVLNYSAGKVLADIGQFDDAFPYYIEGNRIRGGGFDGTYLAPFKNNRETFSRGFYQSRQDFGLPTDQPVFIFGMPRSGTTLIESLCGAHSQITAGDEQPYMSMLSTPLGIASTVPGAFKNMVENMPKDVSIKKAEQYLKSTQLVAGDTKHFTDKLPHNFATVGLIAMIFPNAKVIHCRRHPIDNCLSIFTNSMLPFHNAYKSDLKTLGLYYRQYWQMMQFWREVLPKPMHEVYYEDVVANTEMNARAIMDHIGLEWEDGVMNREGSQKSVKTLSSWQVRLPIYTTSAGRWRQYEKHLAPLIDTLGPIVEEYENELMALNSQANKNTGNVE